MPKMHDDAKEEDKKGQCGVAKRFQLSFSLLSHIVEGPINVVISFNSLPSSTKVSIIKPLTFFECALSLSISIFDSDTTATTGSSSWLDALKFHPPLTGYYYSLSSLPQMLVSLSESNSPQVPRSVAATIYGSYSFTLISDKGFAEQRKSQRNQHEEQQQ